MRRVTLFLVVILLWSIVPISAVSAVTDPNHNPIEIIGDESFTPENGVIGGSGTPEDPYIIANWVINASGSAFGIHIANTRAYFVIRNVTIYGGVQSILLENVSNAMIEASQMYNAEWDGIAIVASSGVTVYSTIIQDIGGSGIHGWDSTGLILEHNEVTNTEKGITLERSKAVVRYNNLTSNRETGTTIWETDGVEIYNNTISSNGWVGIFLYHSINIVIGNNTLSNNQGDGILLESTNETDILENVFSENQGAGVSIGASKDNIVSENTFESNNNGVTIGDSLNITIIDNSFLNSEYPAIEIHNSEGLIIQLNYVYATNHTGIWIWNATSITIENNTVLNSTYEGIWAQYMYNSTISNNDLQNNEYSGVTLVDSENSVISGNFLKNNKYSGVSLERTNSSSVINNTILNVTEGDGIYLWNATKNVIANNYIKGTGEDGVQLQYSPNNMIVENYIDHGDVSTAQGIDTHNSPYLQISENTITNANNGIYLFLNSHNSNITKNNIFNNGAGIVIEGLINITISENKVSNNSRQGIVVQSSREITLTNNFIEGSGYNGVEFYTVTNAIVMGNQFIHNNHGAFQADNSMNLYISDNRMEETNAGVVFRYNTQDSLVENNFIANNEKGFWIWEANNNTFVNNTVVNNAWTGVFIYNSTDNVFYLNHFENSQNVILENSIAQWYSPEPISYDYNGTTIIIPGTQFTNYLGNYWSDYMGRDTNGDGIGEEPYYIDSNNYDPYPISYMIKPVVLTDIAREITNTSAVFRGTLLDTGGSTSVEVWFEYGLSMDNLTQTTSHQVLLTEESFEIGVFDLVPNTTYYFRAVAKNEIGTAYGRILSFTTPLTGNYTVLQKGPASDLIRITLANSEGDGITKTAEGNLDIFLWSVSGNIIQSLPNETITKLKLVRTTTGYNDIELNPVHDDDSPYLVTVNNKTYFNPFAIREIRHALNFLLNRQYFVQEYLGGHGQPMFGGIRPSSGAGIYFEPVYNALGLTPEGNQNKALIMIEEAMQKASQDLAVQGYTLEKINGTWYFEGEPVIIKGVIRIEDHRKEIGLYVADMLEKAGLKVERLLWDRSTAGRIVYGTDPREYKWSFYTAGWVSTVNIKWPDVYTAWWYASWYGWLPGAVGWEIPREDLVTFGELVNEFGGPDATIAALQLKYYNTTEKLTELYNMTTEEITKLLVLRNLDFNNKTYTLEENNANQYWDLQKISMA
ncbi:right-handed parallel beta-helix repeat-containing protein, partial [Thermococcus sp. EP1]|uniref:right-handed parallel beta-helix repeat-containing protein n=1 Tax=Thermococcus sp. EP1 TaxID=1591054 RepID=UPI000B1BF6DD